MDLMFLDGKSVLQIVDTATYFCSATFLDAHGGNHKQSVQSFWIPFVMTWCEMYTGYPNILPTNKGSIFTSARWKQLKDMNGVQLRLSGGAAHSPFSISERYHEPIIRIYHKIQFIHRRVSLPYAFRVAVKAMEETVGKWFSNFQTCFRNFTALSHSN